VSEVPLVSGKQRGQALVELALVFLALCSLFVAAFDYGQAMNVYLVAVHATREAARVGTVAGTSFAAIQSAARNAASDTLPASALTVTCQSASFDASAGSYTITGACPDPMVADSAFVVSVSATVSPVLPFTGLLFGSLSVGPLPLSYTLLGIVEPNS
jgi:Flp pilus assembly protein TadG